jgi:hypothetical protein
MAGESAAAEEPRTPAAMTVADQKAFITGLPAKVTDTSGKAVEPTISVHLMIKKVAEVYEAEFTGVNRDKGTGTIQFKTANGVDFPPFGLPHESIENFYIVKLELRTGGIDALLRAFELASSRTAHASLDPRTYVPYLYDKLEFVTDRLSRDLGVMVPTHRRPTNAYTGPYPFEQETLSVQVLMWLSQTKVLLDQEKTVHEDHFRVMEIHLMRLACLKLVAEGNKAMAQLLHEYMIRPAVKMTLQEAHKKATAQDATATHLLAVSSATSKTATAGRGREGQTNAERRRHRSLRNERAVPANAGPVIVRQAINPETGAEHVRWLRLIGGAAATDTGCPDDWPAIDFIIRFASKRRIARKWRWTRTSRAWPAR